MRVTKDRLNRARAALEAQPEPQGPSELELEAIELKLWDKHRTKGYMGEEFMYDNDFSAALDEYRAALARWGRPAIEPEPPSLKEQALEELTEIDCHYIPPGATERIDIIRRALEALPND
jgi:hypothetical protein